MCAFFGLHTLFSLFYTADFRVEFLFFRTNKTVKFTNFIFFYNFCTKNRFLGVESCDSFMYNGHVSTFGVTGRGVQTFGTGD